MKIKKFGLLNYRSFPSPAGDVLDVTTLDLPLHAIDFSRDVIIVVGENNSGKTNLMSAYRDFRNAGFAPDTQDFFDCKPECTMVMEIAIEADSEDELEDDQVACWFSSDQRVARIRKVWSGTGKKATKYSLEPTKLEWIEGGFGGFDQILQSRLPEPVHIRPDMTSDEIRIEFQKLFKEIVQRYVADSEHVKVIEKALAALVSEIEEDTYIKDVAERVKLVAADIFPNLSVEIRNPTSDKGIGTLLDKQTDINLVVSDSPSLQMNRHGQGSQRVFMLSALSVLAGELAAVSKKVKGKVGGSETSGGKIIQIEEPELYLSPTAVRKMRELIYSLAAQPGVQVMACTHSPVMVDFSRPKQTIVLVERGVKGSRLHQSSFGDLAKDPKDALRLLYQLNPVLSEALFANKVILVEGDTEFAAISRLLSAKHISTDTLDVHVIQCGGKGNLPAFQRVLREFGKRYLVVHDLDVTYANKQSDEVMWRANEAIWGEVSNAQAAGVGALGFVFNLDFEKAHNYQKLKPAIASAINFIDQAIQNNSLSGTPIDSLLQSITSWTSPLTSIQDVQKLI